MSLKRERKKKNPRLVSVVEGEPLHMIWNHALHELIDLVGFPPLLRRYEHRLGLGHIEPASAQEPKMQSHPIVAREGIVRQQKKKKGGGGKNDSLLPEERSIVHTLRDERTLILHLLPERIERMLLGYCHVPETARQWAIIRVGHAWREWRCACGS